MTDALDLRRPLRQPHQFAGALQRLLAGVERRPLQGDRRRVCDTVHHLDLVAVRLGQPHALAAAGLVEMSRCRVAPAAARDALEVVLALGVIGETDNFGIALLGDVEVVRRIGAAHVERGRRAFGAHHAEAGQEFLHAVEIRATAAARRPCRLL